MYKVLLAMQLTETSDMAKSIVDTSTTGIKIVGSFLGKLFGK